MQIDATFEVNVTLEVPDERVAAVLGRPMRPEWEEGMAASIRAGHVDREHAAAESAALGPGQVEVARRALLQEVEAPSLRVRETAGLGEDLLKQAVDVPLRRERDPDPVQRRDALLRLPEALRLPEVRKEFLAHGAEPSPLGPDEFAKFVKVEVEKWGKVVKSTGMTIN